MFLLFMICAECAQTLNGHRFGPQFPAKFVVRSVWEQQSRSKWSARSWNRHAKTRGSAEWREEEKRRGHTLNFVRRMCTRMRLLMLEDGIGDANGAEYGNERIKSRVWSHFTRSLIIHLCHFSAPERRKRERKNRFSFLPISSLNSHFLDECAYEATNLNFNRIARVIERIMRYVLLATRGGLFSPLQASLRLQFNSMEILRSPDVVINARKRKRMHTIIWKDFYIFTCLLCH